MTPLSVPTRQVVSRWRYGIWLFLVVGIGLMCDPALAAEGTPPGEIGHCDRACLIALSDRLLAAVVDKRESEIPLRHVYSATENGIATSPSSMTIWRLVTGVKRHLYVVDPDTQQVYIISTVTEGGLDSVMYGRLKAEDRQIAELELYVLRSRGQDGVTTRQAGGAAELPPEWTTAVDPSRLPSREELVQMGRSKFDRAITPLPGNPACRLMEEGKIIGENPSVWAALAPKAAPRPLNADGTVSIPCGGAMPNRPADANARTDIVDVVQGIVVTRGTIQAHVVPYVMTTPTESVEVPDSLESDFPALESMRRLSGDAGPSIRSMPVTSFSSAVYRIYDHQIQGMMLLFQLFPRGARNPFMEEPAK